jgi:SPP1 gp7 family putative phage head morphogenesis protein
MLAEPKPKTLAPIRPNVGIEHSYARKLEREITAMQVATTTAIFNTWRENPPTLAMDASAAADLRTTMAKLGTTWRRRFSILANEMARYFATSAAQRVDASLRASLAKAGFAVKFSLTPAMHDALTATTAENVALIKSIPAEHLKNIEGDVFRSVQAGRDLGTLARTLTETYGVTKRRAALIARDQNNKATATITHTRQQELGIKQAKWLHSAGGKRPRPSHVANSGKLYDVATGWFDPDMGTWLRPGEAISCRCVSVSVIEGFG